MSAHIAILLCLAATPGRSEPLDWLWAKGIGDTGDYERGVAVAADSAGNCYVTGYFTSPTVTFTGRTNTVIVTNVVSPGDWDIFLAKYSPAGELLWAQRAGGSGPDWPWAIATDGTGSVIITGSFAGPDATFGTDANTVRLSANRWALFIAKYAPDGRLLWAQSGQGFPMSDGQAVQVDARGNIVVEGTFGGMITGLEGPLTLGTPGYSVMLTNTGSWDVFLARFSPEGHALGAAVVAGGGDAYGDDLAVDAAGDIYLSGSYRGGQVVVGAAHQAIVLTNSALDEATFMAKLDSNFGALCVRPKGGQLAVDGEGNLYVASSFSTNLILGTDQSSVTLTSAGQRDLFLAKYNSAGELLWAKQAGGDAFDSPMDLDVDASGNVHVVGAFGEGVIGTNRTYATFGEGGMAVTLWSTGETGGDLSGLSPSDIFVASYGLDGTFNWAKQAGGASLDSGWGITSDRSGGCYVTGFFEATALFRNEDDSFTLTNTAPVEFTQDAFLARMGMTPRFTGLVRATTGEVDLTLTGSSGLEVELQASDTLQNWVPVSTLQLPNDALPVRDTSALGSTRRFYRLVQP